MQNGAFVFIPESFAGVALVNGGGNKQFKRLNVTFAVFCRV